MSESARNTRKRARIGSADEDSDIKDASKASQNAQAEVRLEEREKDEEFWYDDGNIVVVARDVGFRIYKGLLADCSPVLREMFSTPQTHAASSSSPTAPVLWYTSPILPKTSGTYCTSTCPALILGTANTTTVTLLRHR